MPPRSALAGSDVSLIAPRAVAGRPGSRTGLELTGSKYRRLHFAEAAPNYGWASICIASNRAGAPVVRQS
jgi:hypothetical protein